MGFVFDLKQGRLKNGCTWMNFWGNSKIDRISQLYSILECHQSLFFPVVYKDSPYKLVWIFFVTNRWSYPLCCVRKSLLSFVYIPYFLIIQFPTKSMSELIEGSKSSDDIQKNCFRSFDFWPLRIMRENRFFRVQILWKNF